MASNNSTESLSKGSCSSPRPMAFTVDFGTEDKKLALRDSIGRFAPSKPAKIKSKLAATKDNTNLKNDELVILDEENNIATASNNEELVSTPAAVSDAGTYTIDDEDEDPKVDQVTTAAERDKDIHRAFGVSSEKVSAREWVSVWASNSFAEDNPIQEEEDLEQERCSSSQQRRRLPATPLRLQNGYGQHKDNHETQEDNDTNVMSKNGGRSTSSLSSKEAEFQAWKRRKNYNPMRSATASVVQSSKTMSSPRPSAISHKAVTTKTNSVTCSSAPENKLALSGGMHKRSASFHYPDGTSRVTHSVYSSEEDFNDEEEEDDEPRLYEVNDDELFLAYDSGGVVAPRRTHRRTPPRGSGAGSTSSTQSASKLEALDNLVISTIFSVSTKLCILSGKLVKSVQDRTSDKEEETMLQTLLYVLEDIDPPVSPSKKTSRELAGTLRNLKKVEQALQTLERSEADL